jgi:hypothetical protein
MSRSERVARLVVVVVAVAITVGLLGWAAGSPVTICRGLRSPGQTFDGLVTGGAALSAWIGLAWFGCMLALEAAAALPGWCGRACGCVAARVAPRLVRRIAQALIGVTVLAGPLAGGSAMASERPQQPATVSVVMDRPAAVTELLTVGPSPAPSPSQSTSSSQSSTPSSSPSPSPSLLSALFDLDRPDLNAGASAFVAAAPPSPVKQAPSGPAALVTGTVHRDNAIDSYVVHRGDALWDIAARHLGPHATAADVAREWPRWYAANRDVIGPDPGVIRPGELLRPPA